MDKKKERKKLFVKLDSSQRSFTNIDWPKSHSIVEKRRNFTSRKSKCVYVVNKRMEQREGGQPV